MTKLLTTYITRDLVYHFHYFWSRARKSGKLDFWDEHLHTYGTDAGKDGCSQQGGWQNICILFANVSGFSIENIHMVDFHCWGISLEACSFGSVKNIRFEASMSK